MFSSTHTDAPVLNVRDSAEMFHIVVPQRSALAQGFDRDISPNQTQAAFFCGQPFTFPT